MKKRNQAEIETQPQQKFKSRPFLPLSAALMPEPTVDIVVKIRG